MGGCIVGPGENPLRPGEIAIQMNRCARCKKRMDLMEAFHASSAKQYDMKDRVYGTVVCDKCWKKK